MGWGRTFLLGDIGNRLDIEDTERDIALLKQKMMRERNRDVTQDKTIRRLMEENDEMKLYLSSLIRLLMQKNLLTKEELESMVQAIDAEDGNVDGKSSGQMV